MNNASPLRKRTFARWRILASIQFSMLRALEYERLPQIKLSGFVLDVGGGIRNSYRHLLQLNGELESLNVDPTMNPTYLADLNKPLPIPDGRYDMILSLNTLEHIANDRLALSEMCRILKPGGSAHIIVPYLYRIHGSPHDYHRHTAAAWRLMLAEAGFSIESIHIEPLAYSRLTSVYAICEFMLPKPVRWIFRNFALGTASLRDLTGFNPDGEFDLPLGYYILASRHL